ncbi:MAG: hypothetical protein FJY99_03905 [Candidatus Sericytochromatia bacterium]|nr:hypothetical protein [Candidatus Tanganyikabacteria bacterium]
MIQLILVAVLSVLGLSLGSVATLGPGIVTQRLAVSMTRAFEGTPLAVGEVAWLPRAATHATWGEVGDFSGSILVEGATLSVAPIRWSLSGVRVEPASLLGTPSLAVPASLSVTVRVRDAEMSAAIRDALPGLLQGRLPFPEGVVPQVALRGLAFAEGRIQVVLTAKVPMMGGMALPVQASVRPVLLPEGTLGIEDLSVRLMGQELGRRLPIPARLDLAAFMPAGVSDARVSELSVADGVLSLGLAATVRQLPAAAGTVEPAL